MMDAKGLSTIETARRVRENLPEGDSFAASNISHYRTGRSMPRPSYLEALSVALGVTKGELTGMNEAPPVVLVDHAHTAHQDNHLINGSAHETTTLPEPARLKVEDLGDRAHIELSQTLPWPIVLRILQALKAAD